MTLAPIITVITYQMNTKRALLPVLSGATLCTCLGYLLLGATSGFALNVVCPARNFCFCYQKEGSVANRWSAGLFALVMVILGVLSWQGLISLLIIAALALNTVCMSFGNPQLLRKSILLTSTLVLLYNVVVISLGGIVNEGLAIASVVVGILRYRK